MSHLKWEYKRVTVWGTEGPRDDDHVSRQLSSAFGEAGWELVSVFFQPQEGYVYYFKRLKEANGS